MFWWTCFRFLECLGFYWYGMIYTWRGRIQVDLTWPWDLVWVQAGNAVVVWGLLNGPKTIQKVLPATGSYYIYELNGKIVPNPYWYGLPTKLTEGHFILKRRKAGMLGPKEEVVGIGPSWPL